MNVFIHINSFLYDKQHADHSSAQDENTVDALWKYRKDTFKSSCPIKSIFIMHKKNILDISLFQAVLYNFSIIWYSHFHFGMGLKSCLPSRHHPEECREDCSCLPCCWESSVTDMYKKMNKKHTDTGKCKYIFLTDIPPLATHPCHQGLRKKKNHVS